VLVPAVSGRAGPVRLLPALRDPAAKLEAARALLAGHAEGVVCKAAAGRYMPGRASPEAVRVKFRHTVDAVVVGAGSGGKANLVLACYKGGRLVEVGEVSALTGDGPASGSATWSRSPTSAPPRPGGCGTRLCLGGGGTRHRRSAGSISWWWETRRSWPFSWPGPDWFGRHRDSPGVASRNQSVTALSCLAR
jgi:hypothetical protein